MRFVIVENKKNGSKLWGINQLVDRFHKSSYNRDNSYALEPGEDINNSSRHRLYNKGDVKELLKIFAEFFQWIINEDNVSKIYITKDITLIRESKLPRIKMATCVDVQRFGDKVEDGKYYITDGKYAWSMWLTGDAFKAMQKLRDSDPEFINQKKELQPVVEEKNKHVKPKN